MVLYYYHIYNFMIYFIILLIKNKYKSMNLLYNILLSINI
jgi:hypothetical protein